MMPNFLVIGAAKSGTSSLHAYLFQHPEIFMSKVKEPRYFAVKDNSSIDISKAPWKGTITSLQDYQKLFLDVKDEKAIGEASPLYLGWSEISAENILFDIPQVRLIAVLRQPADRAFSHFLHDKRHGLIKKDSFDDYLKNHKKNKYINLGMYHQLLQPYYARFNTEQIRIFLFDDLKNNISDVLENIFCFLGVDKNIKVDTRKKYNTSATPRNLFLDKIYGSKIIRKLSRVFPDSVGTTAQKLYQSNLHYSILDSSTRKELTEEFFKDDILLTGNLIGRNLSHWLA